MRSPVRPQHDANPTVSLVEKAAAEGDKERDDMEERAEDLLRQITELEEKVIREEGRRPIVSPVPNRPSEEEV